MTQVLSNPSANAQGVVLRPEDLPSALELLAGGTRSVVGGGVRYMLERQKGEHRDGRELVSLQLISGLHDIDSAHAVTTIGAGVRLEDLAANPQVQRRHLALAEASGLVATARIRRLVTIGGNIAPRDASHDPPVALAALGANARLESSRGIREVLLDSFVELTPDEILTAVSVPVAPEHSGSAFEKFLVRGVWEYACVNAAAQVRLSEDSSVSTLRVAIGTDGGPMSRTFDGGSLQEVCGHVATWVRDIATMRSDVRGSADYKHRMAAVYAQRAVRKAAARAGGEQG